MNITLRDLLDAGVHFGHQTRRYNPRSKKFVYDHRHGISIINLEKTYEQLELASQYIEDLVAGGKDILFVATKRQAQEIVREGATACNMPFAVNRWLGGTLTNYTTIKTSVDKYKKYLAWESDGTLDKMHNKEASAIRREMSRMNRNFEGIVDMKGEPGAMFVVDVRNENIAVTEANRLKIPVIGVVDTNADPSVATIPVPSNDDSIKSIRIIVEVMMDAVQAGLARRQVRTNGPRNIAPIVATEEVVDAPVLAPTEEAPAEAEAAPEVPESFSSES